MTRRRERKRPPLGMPKGVILHATPVGWRTTVLTVNGGRACGRLPGVASDADPVEARTAAAEVVAGLAHRANRTPVGVLWDPSRDSRSWTGRVTLVAGGVIRPAPHAGLGACPGR